MRSTFERMEPYEKEYQDESSNFDDRMELEEYYFPDTNDETEPFKDDDLYYRHLEEY